MTEMNVKLTNDQRSSLVEAVDAVGGFRAAARIAPLSDRCLRKAANDKEATFRRSTVRTIEETVALLNRTESYEPDTPGESRLDQIERKLDLIIEHLGI
jgi:hypothetical protein